MQRPGPLAWCVLALLTLAACGGDEPATPPRPDDAYSRAARFDYVGSMPGEGLRGRTLHADGRYEIWDEPDGAAERRVARTLAIPPDEVRAFFDTLRLLRFLDLEPTEADTAVEYASGMELHGPDGAHRVWWARAQDAPPKLRVIPQTLAGWEHRGG